MPIFVIGIQAQGIRMQINTDLSNHPHFGKKYFNISRSNEKLEDVDKYHNEDIEDIGTSSPDRSMYIQIFRFICARSKQCIGYDIRVLFTYLDRRQGEGAGKSNAGGAAETSRT
jgi:hypothetical protein